MIFRTAAMNEIDVLVQLRKQQLIDEGTAPEESIDETLPPFFARRMGDGSMVEWVAEENGAIVATAAIIFYDFPPTYTNQSGIRGYVTNVYTAPEYRRQGIATRLLDRVVGEARQRGVKRLWLGASQMGRPVYRKYGFAETDEFLELTDF